MEILVYSLQTGLLLSAVLCAVVLISLFSNPEIWVDDYPPDVKAHFGPIGEKARRQRRWAALAFFLPPLLILYLSLPGLAEAAGQAPSYWLLFVHSFIALEVFNLVDLLILDWLLFVTLQPSRLILPGTRGLAGYQDYGFHFRGFLIGHAFVSAFSLVFAGIAILAS